MAAKDAETPTRVHVTNALDPKIGEWVAVSRSPKFEARGLNAGQSLDRIKSLLKRHFGHSNLELVEKILLPKELEERVAKVTQVRNQLQELRDWLEGECLPLSKDLQKHGLMQKQAAEMVGLSATWLGSMSRRAGTTAEVRKPAR